LFDRFGGRHQDCCEPMCGDCYDAGGAYPYEYQMEDGTVPSDAMPEQTIEPTPEPPSTVLPAPETTTNFRQLPVPSQDKSARRFELRRLPQASMNF
jgi:hypothetical protein